jgi:hypothetical protein
MRMQKVITIIAVIMLISLCGANGIAAQCGSGNLQFGLVGLVAGNPFQAETVRTMVFGEEGSAPSVQKPGIVARDRLGRIRSEFVNGKYTVKTGEEAGKEVEWKIITICDPFTGNVTQLDPLGKTARVVPHSRDDAQDAAKQPRNYCESLLQFKNSHPDYEGLGHRTIEGLDAEGIHRTDEPRHTDASGTVMPERMNEQWCAPDLQAVILQVSQDVIREVLELKNIERVEPDPALFEVPRDYTIVEKISQPLSKPPVQPAEQHPAKNPG